MKIKSNPFVYPYVPFYDLSKKNIKNNIIKKKIIKTDDLKKIIEKIKIKNFSFKGNNTSEKILNIFLNKEIIFGPKSYILNNKKFWIKKINYFIEKKEALHFTILGFPFKIPVPLKTNRNLPDLGELLSLKRLYNIASLIKKIWDKGAVIHIITEGAFGNFNNLSQRECQSYLKQLKRFIKLFNWSDTLKITELKKMESLSENFKMLFEEKIDFFQKEYEQRKPKFMKKYLGAKPSILRIVNSRKFNLKTEELMDLYNEKIDETRISDKIKSFRKILENEAHQMVIKYLAYLSLRDDLKFMEKFFPNTLPLSVSPKPMRLGIIPIDRNNIRLPYHGVVVYHKNKKIFTIEYLIDLMRFNSKITPVYWDDDLEDKPFYYEVS